MEKKHSNMVLAKMMCTFVLVILVSVPLLTTEASFVNYKKAPFSHSNFYSSIQQVATNSLTQCVTLCEHTGDCVAISYNSNGTCELNQHEQDDQFPTTVREDGWNIYVKRQAGENKATAFTFGFIWQTQGIPKVYVVSTHKNVVTITSPLLGKIYEGPMINGKEMLLPGKLITSEHTGIFRSSLHLEAHGPVDVYVENVRYGSTDGSVVIPEKHLSTKYVILSWRDSDSKSEYSVIGLVDNTDVNITSPNGNLKKLKLNHDQTYHYGAFVEISGTRISSSENIAVFAGSDCAAIVVSGPCDHLYEQMPPIHNLQKEYIVSFPYPRDSYALRVIAVKDNTEIRFNSKKKVVTLNRNQYFTDVITDGALAITATDTIMVATYSLGGPRGGNHDGSMLIVPGLSQFKANYTMFVPENVDTCVLMVTYPSYTSSINNIRLNDLKLIANESVEVTVDGRGRYTVLYVEVSKGISEIYTVDGTPFGAYLSFFRRISESWFNLSYKF